MINKSFIRTNKKNLRRDTKSQLMDAWMQVPSEYGIYNLFKLNSKQ